GPFIKQLEAFANEGIFMPLNPIDLIKNLNDYQASIGNAPNLARFALKFFDDFAVNSPEPGAFKQIARKMGLDSTMDLPNAKLLYQTVKKSINNNKDGLAAELRIDNEGEYTQMIKRLDTFFLGV
ncbi:MAG: hypothetical protein OXE99_03990, partial [Cellvibrionales bacterium]|nr:hypothetical protein [Cellvibrionales bacterium]